jgi:hypothetical protein
VVSSTVAAALRQLVMFVVDKVVEEHRCMLLANELQSITLPDWTTQALVSAARDAFAIFEDLCLLGNGERPRFVQLEYLHKTFALELIESVLMNYHELLHKVCLFSPLPIRDLYASCCPQITVMFTAFRALTLITTPPLPPAPQTLSELSAFPFSLPGTRIVILLKQLSSELEMEAEVILTLLIKLISGETDLGEPRPGWLRVLVMEIMGGKFPLCSSFLAHWLTGTRPRDPLRI